MSTEEQDVAEYIAEHEAYIATLYRSSDPAVVLEVVMRRHLPIKLPDDTVMCMCHHTGGGFGLTIFDGPVRHREHVAALQVEALREAGFPIT